MASADAHQKYDAMAQARAALSQLFEAAKRGDVLSLEDCVSRAISEGGGSREDTLAAFRDGHRRHALHFGAASGSVAAVHWLAEACAKLVDEADENGVTPLALAASQGKTDACEALVLLGADVGRRDSSGVTALHRAAAFEGSACGRLVELLCSAGADVAAVSASSGTALHWAAGNSDELASVAATEALLARGSPIEAADERGLTPLVLAAAMGNGQTVAALARAGADVGLIVSGGATVAHICAEQGDLDALQAIAESPNHGQTALRAIDATGRTPLDVAHQQSHTECVTFLKAQGVEASANVVVHHSQQQAPPQSTLQPPPPSQRSSTSTDAAGALRKKECGNEALKRGDYETAVAEYSAAIDLDASNKALFSNRSAARLGLAVKTNDTDLVQAALVDADACVALDPAWPKAHFRRASALQALEKYEDAANAFWDALRLDPSNAQLRAALQKCVQKGRQHHFTGADRRDESATPQHAESLTSQISSPSMTPTRTC